MHNLGWLGIVVYGGIALAEVLALVSLPLAFIATRPALLRAGAWVNGALAAALLVLGVIAFVAELRAGAPESAVSAGPWDALGFFVGMAVLPALAALACWLRARA